MYQNCTEEAGRIIDQLLIRGIRTFDLYLVAALVALMDRRFQEAKELLAAASYIEEQAEVEKILSAVKAIVHEQSIQTPHRDKEHNKTYVIADQHDGFLEYLVEDALARLESNDNVIVVLDQMESHELFKRHYGEQICSTETEHKVWQRYEGEGRKIRTLLKNNNNGIHVQALKMGIRKALGAGAQEVLTKVNSTWSTDLSMLVKQADGANEAQSTSAIRALQNYIPTKRVALLGVTRLNHGQGVPVVMLNIARGLRGSPFTFSYICNNFDANRIEYFDESGLTGEFENRASLVQFLWKHSLQFNVLHFHSWHFADHYKPFHSGRDGLRLADWLEQLKAPGAKTIYTDHANPTDDLRRIQVHHGIDYEALCEKKKENFLNNNTLWDYSLHHWQKGWDATAILSRREMMQAADYVTHVSEIQKIEEERYILTDYTAKNGHAVVWNGTDMIHLKNIPRIKKKAEKIKRDRIGPTVMYVGRAEKEKGIFDLAEAAARLRRLDAPINLIYAGNFSQRLRSELDAIAGQRNIYTGVITDRSELAAHYAAVDLVAQPTWGECFNQVVSEALAMGTPSVVSNISGPKEIYLDNGIAFGHQPQSPASLAQEIGRAIGDHEARIDIIKKGKSFVEERLSVKHMVDQYIKIYNA